MAATDEVPANQAGTSRKLTITQVRGYLTNASTVTVSGGYAADTYLAGSAITIPAAGKWKVGTIYRCRFDILKSAAGTATPIIIVRMGTLGTTGDAAILTNTLSAGTAAADTGQFFVEAAFRTIGAGAAAVLQQTLTISHGLAATGITGAGASGFFANTVTSAGFDSTTQTIIGVSFNGGASFSGTNTLVVAELQGI